MTPEDSGARLQPDTSRRVIIVSPGTLPAAIREAEEFVLGIAPDSGLQRVRIQARRDARGGWITIVDAHGDALRQTPAGIAVKRSAGSRTPTIESLRVEMTFRTTNPRILTSIAAIRAGG